MIVLCSSSFQAIVRQHQTGVQSKRGVRVEREENSESIPIVRLVSPIAVAAAAVLQLLDPLRHFCGIWPATTILLQFNAMLPPPPGRLSWLSKMVQEIRESNAAQLTTSTVGSLLYFDGWRVEPPSSSSSPYKLSYWDLQADRQDAHSGKKRQLLAANIQNLDDLLSKRAIRVMLGYFTEIVFHSKGKNKLLPLCASH